MGVKKNTVVYKTRRGRINKIVQSDNSYFYRVYSASGNMKGTTKTLQAGKNLLKR